MNTLPLYMEPDPDEPEFARPFVDGTIDGRPYRFLLDTGGSQSVVATDDYISTFPVAGEKQSRGAFNAALTDELVVVSSLAVGPIEKSDLVVVRSAGGERPSLIGMDVLGDMALVIDLENAQLQFAPGGSLPTSWPMRRSPRGHPYLDLEFPGAVANMVWDTGASVTIVDTGFVAANGSLFTPIGSSVGTDSTGESHDTPMYRMAAATVGDITIAEQTVAAVSLPQEPMSMHMVLGYLAIRRFVWTMDFPSNRWAATPSAAV